jgi:flagellar protein FlaF
MSIQAYQNTAKRTECPRQNEYRTFAEATRALIEAASLPTYEIGRRMEALSLNRRLWTVLAADCATEGNQLPPALRAQIISLSIFIDKHSSQVMREGASIDVLIEINRSVMQGLQPVNPQAGQPAA